MSFRLRNPPRQILFRLPEHLVLCRLDSEPNQAQKWHILGEGCNQTHEPGRNGLPLKSVVFFQLPHEVAGSLIRAAMHPGRISAVRNACALSV
jgi:hypothetical protein